MVTNLLCPLWLENSKSHLDNLAYPKAHWMKVNQEMTENVYWACVVSPSLFAPGGQV